MVERIKRRIISYKSNIGPGITLIGAIMLLFAGFILYGEFQQIVSMVHFYGESLESLGVDPSLLELKIGSTIGLGLGALCGAILAFKFRKIGGIICIILGVIALIGPFITIGYIDLTAIGGEIVPINLNALGFFVDPILLIIGGIVCIVSKPEIYEKEVIPVPIDLNHKERKNYLKTELINPDNYTDGELEEINWKKQKKKEKDLKKALRL